MVLSLFTGGMQIQSTTYYYTYTRTLKCKRLKVTSIAKDIENLKLCAIAGGSITLENY